MHEPTGTNKLLNKHIESKGISPPYRRTAINNCRKNEESIIENRH